MIKINTELSAFDNLCELIQLNQTEELPIDLTDEFVEFEDPVEFQGDGINNTEITMVALLDQGYSGEVTVNYYRPTLDDVKLSPESQIQVDNNLFDDEDPDTIETYESHVLNVIADALGLIADQIEFSTPGSVPVPFSENTPEQVDIRPKVASLVYSGPAITVTFAAIDTDIPLEDVITVTTLSGFEF